MKALSRWRATRDNGIRWRLEFKAADLWIGMFWKERIEGAGQWRYLDVWICLLPCLPLHFEVELPIKDAR